MCSWDNCIYFDFNQLTVNCSFAIYVFFSSSNFRIHFVNFLIFLLVIGVCTVGHVITVQLERWTTNSCQFSGILHYEVHDSLFPLRIWIGMFHRQLFREKNIIPTSKSGRQQRGFPLYDLVFSWIFKPVCYFWPLTASDRGLPTFPAFSFPCLPLQAAVQRWRNAAACHTVHTTEVLQPISHRSHSYVLECYYRKINTHITCMCYQKNDVLVFGLQLRTLGSVRNCRPNFRMWW